jgi:hypothetical protein
LAREYAAFVFPDQGWKILERDNKFLRGGVMPVSYMRAPTSDHNFEVGETVEVFCDHEKNKDRVRGWIKGIVVQVDIKMVAVQFRSNVYLTDGWMVPDKILWYPFTSKHLRPHKPGRKQGRKEVLEY